MFVNTIDSVWATGSVTVNWVWWNRVLDGIWSALITLRPKVVISNPKNHKYSKAIKPYFRILWKFPRKKIRSQMKQTILYIYDRTQKLNMVTKKISWFNNFNFHLKIFELNINYSFLCLGCGQKSSYKIII